MKGTFTIPGQLAPGAHVAERVRIGSERRYVVLAWRYESHRSRSRWVIEYRTDDPARARSRSCTGRVILDTETGGILR